MFLSEVPALFIGARAQRRHSERNWPRHFLRTFFSPRPTKRRISPLVSVVTAGEILRAIVRESAFTGFRASRSEMMPVTVCLNRAGGAI